LENYSFAAVYDARREQQPTTLGATTRSLLLSSSNGQ